MVPPFLYYTIIMKNYILTILCLAMAVNSHASDFVENGLYYNITSLSDLTVELAQPDNGHYSGDIIIPETVEYMSRTFSVTGINSDALSECNIGTLSFKDNIKSIGELSIGSVNTFRIEDSDIPLEMAENAYYWYWHHQRDPMSVYIGRNFVTDFDANLFGENCGAVSAEFGTKVTEIPNFLFDRCTTLETVKIPNSIETIGSGAFYETSVTSIQGLGITSIGTGAFDRCASLKSVEFSESLTSINEYAFAGCTSLTDFILPSNTHQLKVIDHSAFEDCTSLTSFVIPEGVCFVGSFAFAGCTSLESVKIPNSVIDFGNITGDQDNQIGNIFKGCKALKTIILGHNTPISTWENSFDASTYISATLKVPAGSSETYKKADYWKNFFDIQEDETIADELCTIGIKDENYYIPEVIEVSITDNYGEWYNYWSRQNCIVTQKGSSVNIKVKPEENYKLVSLNINGEDVISSVIKNEYTFSVNDNMELQIEPVFEYYPYQTIETDEATFEEQEDGSFAIIDIDENITEYIIPETLEDNNGKTCVISRIEANAFKNRVELTSVTIPATITSIGNGAFAGCVNLASIYVYHEEPITFGSAEARRASGSIFDGVNMETCILYVPYGCADKYKGATIWSDFQHIVEMESTSIKDVITSQANDGIWYTLSGHRVYGKPSKKGIYIKNGLKMYIK